MVSKNNGILFASPKDFLATKLNTIQRIAEKKDYVDTDAILSSGTSLTNGLAYAKAIYGPSFDSGTSLRALCSFRDGNLMELSESVKQRLRDAAKKSGRYSRDYSVLVAPVLTHLLKNQNSTINRLVVLHSCYFTFAITDFKMKGFG